MANKKKMVMKLNSCRIAAIGVELDFKDRYLV